jgi:response regulator RpfG family c-di-GMP phosphodiesterase
VLCVDDEPNILGALRRLLRPEGYRVLTAESGEAALAVLASDTPDLILCDMRMPGMDGAEFLARARALQPQAIRVLLTGYADIQSTIAAINRGEIYRYVNKPWDEYDLRLLIRQGLERRALERERARLEALTEQQNGELKHLNASLEAKVSARTEELAQACQRLTVAGERMKANFLTSIQIFSNLIEMRAGHLAGHSRRVADMARRIAVVLELSSRERQDVFLAGLLHDVGKIGLPDELLAMPTVSLTGANLALYRKHPERGEQLLTALEELENVAQLVRCHHERYDGDGYPDRLAGSAIPMGARVLAVADGYDELQSGLLLGRRLSAEAAAQAIAQARGRRYDPEVVDAFLKMLAAGPPLEHGEALLAVSELKPGMRLSRDLMSRDGLLLLAAEHVLSAHLILRIQTHQAAGRCPGELHVRRAGAAEH